jgi:hypothetical protein
MTAIKPTIKLFTSQEDDTTSTNINNLILEHTLRMTLELVYKHIQI